MENGVDVYHEEIQSYAEQRAGHGILVVALNGRVLWTDARAAELCEQMRIDGEREGTLPLPIVKMVKEIGELLELRDHSKDWETFNVKRVIKGREMLIFVVGIGLPAGVGYVKESTALLTVDIIAHRKSVNRLETFQLTTRETTVAGLLLAGSSNKEIAYSIGVTEQTVKEHIKHIMAKTKTTTRTGVIMAIAGPPEMSCKLNPPRVDESE